MNRQTGTSDPRSRRGAGARAVLGALLLLLVIVMPNQASGFQLAVLMPAIPLEWTAILAALLLAAGPAGKIVRALVLVVAGATLLLKLADMGTFAAFDRPFNPLLDAHLFRSGWHLLSGTVGAAQAVAVALLALALFTVAMALLALALRGFARLAGPFRRRLGAAFAAVTLGGALLLHLVPETPFASVAATRFAEERVAILRDAVRDLARFEDELRDDPVLQIPAGDLLVRLRGRDVLVLFVESYGRSAVEGERYRERTLSRLDAVESEIAAAGFAARSGWLTAPTVGGQSWLAHAALLSGLWTDSQQRYDRLMLSERVSLNALFRRAGWRTVAAMPAIIMAWPEARWYGYDTVHDRDGLGYRGAPFNWVTMPDQYTLAALERLELGRADRPPVMAEVALISSHAPWTPIPPLLDWDDVGDGSVLTPFALSGDTPEIVWRDAERVRDQYALSIDYALETIGSFVARFGRDDLVVLVLGDHQPASIVTGPEASRDVPVHLLSADPALLAAVEDWGWTAGMVPASDVPSMGMDRFRRAFVDAFSAAVPP